MLVTQTYTVASEPLPSGELDVRDPSPAEAERAIAENVVDPLQRVSQLRRKPVPKLTPEEKADLEMCLPTQEAADAYFAQFPVPTGDVETFLGAERYQPALDAIYQGLGVPKEFWEPGPFPGTVMHREPGVGTAILSADPEQRARVLRGQL